MILKHQVAINPNDPESLFGALYTALVATESNLKSILEISCLTIEKKDALKHCAEAQVLAQAISREMREVYKANNMTKMISLITLTAIQFLDAAKFIKESMGIKGQDPIDIVEEAGIAPVGLKKEEMN